MAPTLLLPTSNPAVWTVVHSATSTVFEARASTYLYEDVASMLTSTPTQEQPIVHSCLYTLSMSACARACVCVHVPACIKIATESKKIPINYGN